MTSGLDRHGLTIRISARPAIKAKAGAASWRLSITVDGLPTTRVRLLQDPLDDAAKQECRWYVEQFITKSPYSVDRAQKAERILRGYGDALLRSLNLATIVQRRFPPTGAERPWVRIIIHDEGVKPSDASVHQLAWELLEDDNLWPRPVEVTVIRLSRPKAPQEGNLVVHELGMRARSRDGASELLTVRGLVVIARDLSRDSPTSTSDITPDLALRILIQLRDAMDNNKSPLRIQIQVVRPGSLYALERHLSEASERHGKGYFHFVHFDLHGAVLSKPLSHWASGGGASSGPDSAPAGYLLFQDMDLDVLKTRGEEALRVAKLLGKHEIPVAILNACESASATAGDAANTAKLFAQNGVGNVLAMSFKISSSAADVFLRAFYPALLVEGVCFSEAARRGRRALRVCPARQARLGLERDLMDHFVPVVYCHGRDTRFATGTAGARTSNASWSLPFRRSRFDPVSTASQCLSPGKHRGFVGRDFDLLRLERRLLANGIVYMSGRPGVGKSALLRHACEVWTKTGFADCALYLDMAMVEHHRFGIRDFTLQLPLPFEAQRDLGRKLHRIVSNTSISLAGFSAAFWAACPDSVRRVAVVLDGLHAIRRGRGGIIDEYLARLAQGILQVRDTKRTGAKVYTIAASRPLEVRALAFLDGDSDDDEHDEVLVRELNQAHFRLGSLDLAQAIELSTRTIQDAGVSTTEWIEAAWSELSLLMGLLDGNPAAILQVSAQIRKTNDCPKALRAVIHHGVSLSLEWVYPLEPNARTTAGLFADIYKLVFCQMTEAEAAVAILLSVFWIEAVPVAFLTDWFISNNICRAETFVFAIFELLRLGLIETDIDLEKWGDPGPGPHITWLHPLLTVVGRLAAYAAFPPRQVRLRQAYQPPTRRSMLRRLFGGRPRVAKTRRVAAAMVLTVLGAQVDLGPRYTTRAKALVADFPPALAGWINTHEAHRCVTRHIQGFSYDNLSALWPAQAPNLVTCLAACSLGAIPFDKWPMDHFTNQLAQIRIVGSPAQIREVTEYVEALLATALSFFREREQDHQHGDYSDGPSAQSTSTAQAAAARSATPVTQAPTPSPASAVPAIPPEYQDYILVWGICLSAAYASEIPNQSQCRKFTELTRDMIDATEERYRTLASPRTLYAKGVALRQQALAHMVAGERLKAKEAWDASTRVDQSIFAGGGSGSGSRSKGSGKSVAAGGRGANGTQRGVAFDVAPEVLDGLFESLLPSGSDTTGLTKDQIAVRVSAIASGTMTESYYHARKDMSKFIEAVLADDGTGGGGRIGDGYQEMDPARQQRLLGRMAHGMKKIKAGAAKVGFEDVHHDLRWFPEGFDLHAFVHKLDRPEARLAALEEAVAASDGARAARHLMAMLREALARNKLADAEAYIDALEKLARDGTIEELQTVNWAEQRAMCRRLRSTLGILTGDGDHHHHRRNNVAAPPPRGKNSTTSPGFDEQKATSSPTSAAGGPAQTSTTTANLNETVVENTRRQIESMKRADAPQEAIQALEVCLNNWTAHGGEEELACQTPKQEAQLAARLAACSSALFDRAVRRGPGSEFVRNLAANHLRYQTLIRDLSAAERARDWRLALRRVESLRRFFREPDNDVFALTFEEGFFEEKERLYRMGVDLQAGLWSR